MNATGPGWYPDPLDPGRVRWFDGAQWADATAPFGDTVDPVAAHGPTPPGSPGPAVRPGGRQRWALVALAAIAVLVIAATVALVVTAGPPPTDRAAVVRLEPWDHEARAPFAAAAAVGGPAAEVIDAFAADGAPQGAPDRPDATATTARLDSREGGEAGLYATVGDAAPCDRAALAESIVADGATAAAWAAVVGVPTDAIPATLEGFAAVLLTDDVAVTNHRWVDGRAVPYHALLQRGTVVLVDARGVPRVRCSCGNPLAPPRLEGRVRFRGPGWPGAGQSVTSISPSGRDLTELTTVDAATGARTSVLIGAAPQPAAPATPVPTVEAPPPTPAPTAVPAPPPPVARPPADLGNCADGSDCAEAGRIDFDHPVWGPSALVLWRVAHPFEAGVSVCQLVAFDASGAERWRGEFEACGSDLRPASPTADAAGHLFVLFNPGRYDGTIVLAPTADGFADFATLPVGDDYNTRFYSSRVADVDGDGRLEVLVETNDCVPDCAGGSTTTVTYRWNGTDYVA